MFNQKKLKLCVKYLIKCYYNIYLKLFNSKAEFNQTIHTIHIWMLPKLSLWILTHFYLKIYNLNRISSLNNLTII